MSYDAPKKSGKNNNVGSYEPNAPSPQQQQQTATSSQAPIPKTIFIDCNRSNSSLTTDGMNPTTNHSWTCEFPTIQLRTGDEVKVSSAYLNSIGVNDLINWNLTGDDQDNKCRWLIEYYGQNDAKNDKREGYNMLDGRGKYPYPIDNKSALLHRFVPSLSQQTPRANSVVDYTWYEDPYINGRFHGLTVDVPCVEVENSFIIRFVTNVLTGSQVCTDQKIMLMEVRQFYNAPNVAENPQPVNALDLFGAGQMITIQSQEDPKANVGNRATYNHGRYNYKLACFGVYRNWNGTGDNYVMVECPYGFEWAESTTIGDYSLPMTCKFLITSGNPYMLGAHSGGGAVALNDMRVCNFNTIQQYTEPIDNKDWYLYYGLTNTQSTTNNGSNDQVTTDFVNSSHQKQSFTGLGDTTPFVKVNLLDDDTQTHILSFNVLSLSNGGDKQIIGVRFLTLGNNAVNLTSVNELFALNGNTMNFTFNIEKPDGTLETAVCYAGNFHPFSTSGDHQVTYSGSVNEFTFKKVIRDLEDPSHLYSTNDAGINTTIVNTGGNRILLNGFDYTKKIKMMETARATLSATYANNKRATPAISTLPIFYLISGSSFMVENGVNNTITYGGFDRDQQTDYGLSTPLGRSIINIPDSPASLFVPAVILGVPSQFQMKADPESAEVLKADTHEVPHYDFFDFSINEHYSSPSDIATSLTDQTHKLTNARLNGETNNGDEIEDTLGKGIAQNKFLIPVYSTFNDTNIELDAGGQSTLSGSHDAGSYVLKKYIYNLPVNRFTANVYATNGEYFIYFRTKHTTINKPLLAQDSIADLPVAGNEDFNVTVNKPTAICKGDDGSTIGFPIQYIGGQDAHISQYCGANGITFGFDETQSRFTIGYMGQPSVSTFDIKAGTGGDKAVTCFFPLPSGKDGYNFMNTVQRDGGVNITNWKSLEIERDIRPSVLRTTYNIPNTYSMDAKFDNDALKKEWFNDTTINSNVIGNRFWNKLGFSNTQLNTSAVGHTLGTTDQNYTPLGTTALKFDSADALLTSSEPAENTPFYTTEGPFAPPPTGTTDPVPIEAGWEYAGIGGLEMNGHNVGMGMASTAGRPTGFRRNVINGSKFDVLSSSYNPDRQEFNAYTLESDTDTLTADNLPIKSEFGYYYMLSDIVDTDFYVSNQYGSSENIVGVLSKLNVGGDYIYQYQASQTFYVKKDRVLSSVKTTILTPKMKIPVALDPFSSVIYQITRFEPLPDPVQNQPVWLQQEQKWASIMNFINAMSHQLHPKTKTQAQRIQEIISEVANTVIQPLDNQSALQERILGNYQSLGLHKFKTDKRGMREFLLNNPDAQHFLNDLSTYSHNSNNTTNMQVSDPETINPDTLLNTMLNVQPQIPANVLGTAQPNIQDITNNVIDNIQTYNGISNAPVNDLIAENYGIPIATQRQLSSEFDPEDQQPTHYRNRDLRRVGGQERQQLNSQRRLAHLHAMQQNEDDRRFVEEQGRQGNEPISSSTSSNALERIQEQGDLDAEYHQFLASKYDDEPPQDEKEPSYDATLNRDRIESLDPRRTTQAERDTENTRRQVADEQRRDLKNRLDDYFEANKDDK